MPKLLAGIDGFSRCRGVGRPARSHVYHLYVVRHVTARRTLARHLAALFGIQTVVNYPLALPFLPAYGALRNSTPAQIPARRAQLSRRILSLPMYAEMTDEMVTYVAGRIRAFYG